jgi:hypothetical protein
MHERIVVVGTGNLPTYCTPTIIFFLLTIHNGRRIDGCDTMYVPYMYILKAVLRVRVIRDRVEVSPAGRARRSLDD